MDFSTIRMKVLQDKYGSWEELEADLMLMFDNAMLYNSPETIFHQLALSMKNLASKLVDLGRQARLFAIPLGFLFSFCRYPSERRDR